MCDVCVTRLADGTTRTLALWLGCVSRPLLASPHQRFVTLALLLGCVSTVTLCRVNEQYASKRELHCCLRLRKMSGERSGAPGARSLSLREEWQDRIALLTATHHRTTARRGIRPVVGVAAKRCGSRAATTRCNDRVLARRNSTREHQTARPSSALAERGAQTHLGLVLRTSTPRPRCVCGSLLRPRAVCGSPLSRRVWRTARLSNARALRGRRSRNTHRQPRATTV